jgi:hypothetical protein
MVRRGARSGVAVALLLVVAAAAPAAVAAVPRKARIVEGRSMAGVALRSHAPRSGDNTRITAGPMRDWGAVENFCFEGSNCLWDVPGGGSVLALLHPTSSRVQRMWTSARGWRTLNGIRRGSTLRELRGAYGRRLVRRDTCGLNGFGGVNRGFVLNTRHAGERRFTFFVFNAARGRVSSVWIGRGRVPALSGC